MKHRGNRATYQMTAIESNSTSGFVGPAALVWGQVRKVSCKAGNSGMRQANVTNNVAFQASMGEWRKQAEEAAPESVCNQHKVGQLRGCAGKVTAGGKLGHWLAIYWAVPRQGYGRN